MDALALLGLAAVLFLKEAGLPIPVPGDLLVIGAGVASAGDAAAAVVAVAVILAAGFIGGGVQFLLVRGALRRRFIDLLVRIGVSRARLDALTDLLRRRGATGVAVARATPGVRVGAIAAAGLAALRMPVFIGGLVAGNTLFVGGHFLLGYLVGPPAVSAVTGSGTGLLVVGLVALLAVVGALGWRAIRRRQADRAVSRSAGGPASSAAGPPDQVVTSTPGSIGFGFAAWADAACPACLALALVPSGTADAGSGH